MSVFCISDLHFSQAVPKPMDVFGHRWRDYTEKTVKNWNSVVCENDTVIVPGDISWGLNIDEAKDDLSLLDSLNGKKIIGKGNHDLWWQGEKKLREFFVSNGIESISFLHNNAHIVEDIIVCGSRGWFCDPKSSPDGTDYAKIANREILRTEMSFKYAKKLDPDNKYERVAFFHFPPVFKEFISEGIISLMKNYGINRCYYGHIHNCYDIPSCFEHEGIKMNVISADYLNFLPLKI